MTSGDSIKAGIFTHRGEQSLGDDSAGLYFNVQTRSDSANSSFDNFQ